MSKDLLDAVDLDLIIAEVVSLFCPLVKYEVGQIDKVKGVSDRG